MKSYLKYWLGVAGLTTLATFGLWAQKPGTGPPSSGTPGPGAGSRSPSPSPLPNIPSTPGRTTTPGQPIPGQDGVQRPMFLSGRVLLNDGTVPPDSVRIERVCGSRILAESMTDRKGRFSFQIGQNNSLLMDASESGPSRGSGLGTPGANPAGGVRERDLFNCDLRASLPGFRSDVISLANRKFMDNPEIGTIVLHRLGNVEGLTISATTMAAPKDAKKAYDKGHEALAKDKLDDARKHLEKAVAEYPKYAIAWYDLGVVNERQKNLEAARKAFDESLAADPKFISPYQVLAQMAAGDNKWADVAEITTKMIRLNPVDFPAAYFLNSVANLNLKKLDEAERSAKELVQMDTRHQIPKGERVLAIILAQKQDVAGAAAHLRKFIELSPPGPEVEVSKKQLADMEKWLAARGESK